MLHAPPPVTGGFGNMNMSVALKAIMSHDLLPAHTAENDYNGRVAQAADSVKGAENFSQKKFSGACGGGGRGVGGRDKRVPPERVLTSLVGGRDKRVPPECVLTSIVGGRDKRGPPERVLTSLVGGRDKRVPPERVLTSIVVRRDKRVPPEHRCVR